MRKPIAFVCLIVLLITTSDSVAAETTTAGGFAPPWAHPDLIKLASHIDMRGEQLLFFRQQLGAFIDDFYGMIRTELRRNAVDKPRRIRRRTRRLISQLDEDMAGILDERQLPAYELYRDVLIKRLSQAPGQPEPQVTNELPTSH